MIDVPSAIISLAHQHASPDHTFGITGTTFVRTLGKYSAPAARAVGRVRAWR